MFTGIPPVEATIDALIAAGRHHDALLTMMVGVHNHYKAPGVELECLYYPVLDRQVARLSQRLEAAHADPLGPRAPGENTLVVATELGQVGGHARVLLDLLRELPSPVLVLTEAFANHRPGVNDNRWLFDACAGLASVIVLPPELDLWRKCQALQRLTQQLAPGRIFLFNHHQDAVPLVGTLGHAGSRKVFIHHADHNPSLGCTLPGLAHVDLTDELAAICSQSLQQPAQVLPLYVQDEGCKTFAPLQGQAWSVVTSGSAVKFARSGPVALQGIAHAVLSAIDGCFFHIGPLAADWLAEIRQHLAAQGLDAGRFVPLGQVPSLWQALLGLDAHLYLGSAPAGGGRAAIEAQGCGYPLAFHRPPGQLPTTLQWASVYASAELSWSTLDELGHLLRAFPQRQPGFAATARALYDARFSKACFDTALRQLAND